MTSQYNSEYQSLINTLKLCADKLENCKHVDGIPLTKEQACVNNVIDFTDFIKNQVNQFDSELTEVTKQSKPLSDESPFVITFVGKFKTGKSSLINAILGKDILPTRTVTATTVLTRIFCGHKFKAFFCENGQKCEITFEKAQDIILNYRVANLYDSAEVIFELPIPWLAKNVELRDTPGMDDSAYDGALENIALSSLKDTDLCVFVYDASQFLSAKERERVNKAHELLGGNVVYVVNCTNRLNSKDDVSHVKKSAKQFFSSFDYQIEGMGKYYLICSAPGMIELDGLDKWFKQIVGKRFDKLRNCIHSISSSARIESKRLEIHDLAEQSHNTAAELISELSEYHEKRLRESRNKIIDESREKTNDFIDNIVPLAEQIFLDTSGINYELQLRYSPNDSSNWDYLSSQIALLYFEKNFKKVCEQWEIYESKSENGFIHRVIESETFPGKHNKPVSATSGEKNGWTVAGGVIGALFGPLGAAAGAALGRYIGSQNNYEDDTVNNTLCYINGSVVMNMKNAFSEISRDTAKEIVTDGKAYGERFERSGYEDIIDSANSALLLLDDYVNNIKLT